MTAFAAKVSAHLATRKDDESGATAVEYALLIGLLSILLVGALVMFGDDVTDWINDLFGDMTAESSG